MNDFLIAVEFDEHDDSEQILEEQQLDENLRALGVRCRPLRTVWAVRTDASLDRVFEGVRRVLGSRGTRFIVLPAPDEWRPHRTAERVHCISYDR